MENIEQKSGYHKRPLWQWLLFYLVIAIIVYGLVYYFVSTKNNNGPTFNKPLITHSSLPNRQVALSFSPENNSGETGRVSLKQENGQFSLIISLTGEPANIAQPARLTKGQCFTVGETKLKLNPVINGKSETSLQMSIDQLKGFEPLAIIISKSNKEMTTYVSCADLHL